MSSGPVKVVDEFSLLRAIAIAKAKADYDYLKQKWKGSPSSSIPQEDIDLQKTTRWERDKMIRNRCDYQMTTVKMYISEARLHNRDTIFGIHEAKLIQKAFNERYGRGIYRIHIFGKKDPDRKADLIWKGATPSERNIFIIKEDNKFNVPKSMTRLMRNRYYCPNCCTTSSRKTNHTCEWTCRQCGDPAFFCSNESSDFLMKCEECNISFFSKRCFDRHSFIYNNGRKRCGNVEFCSQCSRFFNKNFFAPGEQHVCGSVTFCMKCCRHCEPSKTHTCYMRLPTDSSKKKMREKEKNLKILAFDIETSQCREREDGTFDYENRKHEVVCVVARKACYSCFDMDKDAYCEICIEREKVISFCNSSNVLKDFIDWLLQPSNNERYLFAHYGGKYDFLLVLEELINRKIHPKVIMRGRKIITGSIEIENCRLEIRDSFNLIPLPLASFKKAFGLSCDDKGEFPFLFIEPKRYHTVSEGLPETRYYNIGSKSVAKREAFMEWYNTHDETYIFDFDQELISYCRKDTEILLLGIIAYRKAMRHLTGWDPIPHVSTLASFTSHVLRCDHIPEKTLSNIPENGYNFKRQQSDIALCWLKYIAKKEGRQIQHLENGGEKKILTYYVDGFSEATDVNERGTVFEFLGCYWHGCEECFDQIAINKSTNMSFGTLRACTMARLKEIGEIYNIRSVWECQVRKELKNDKEMSDFFKSCRNGRIRPRDAMQGGRTEQFACSAESSDTHVIVYLDVNSLYPTIMSTAEVPTGQPEVQTNDFPSTPCYYFPYTGLARITILPPRSLRYPLLAVKMKNTLMFTLCRQCSLDGSSQCSHTDDERAISSTWTHVEIRKALQLGYVILEFHEIWKWSTFSNSLFKKYIKTFFTVKTSSSGWPKWVKTEDDKARCVANYKHEMDIDLEVNQVEDNPALRSVSKLLLNTSWGKFAQNAFVSSHMFCDGDELCDLLDAKPRRMSSYRQLGDDSYLVSTSQLPDEVHSASGSNLPIAIYITSWARLHLYSILEASQLQALYCDTDSIIALIPRNNNPFTSMIGDGLGKLTDETPGREIRRAIFGGPKQYGLEMVDLETGELTHTLKIRGLVLDSDARETFNFEKMSDLIRDQESITLERVNIKRQIPYIFSAPEKKRYKPVNTKSFQTEDGQILPFGYESDNGQSSD